MDKRPPSNGRRSRRAQGASEFLVLLGVVLILALFSITIIGMASGSPGDARISLSRAYWSSAAPFALVGYTMTSDGVLTLTLLNRAPRTMTLQGVSLKGDGVDHLALMAKELRSGQQYEKKIALSRTYASQEVFELGINISYEDPDSDLPGQMQMGRELIVERCNGQINGLICGGKICNGDPCFSSSECESNHCPGNGNQQKVCAACNGNGIGQCELLGEQCSNGVCRVITND